MAAADEDKVKDAILKINAGSISIRKAARELKVSEAMIRYRMKRITKGRPIQQRAGPQSLPPESERELALMLNVKAKWGFAADREEVAELVHDYVQANKDADGPVREHIRKCCQFKVRIWKNDIHQCVCSCLV